MKKVDIACIIDDDPIFVFGARRMMELVDFCNSFLVFHNGHDAIEHLRPLLQAGDRLPELILLDLNMPIMDGWQFLDEFTQIPAPQKITIYIVTSSIDPRDVQRVKQYEEVSSYIVKPITADRLKTILEEVNV